MKSIRLFLIAITSLFWQSMVRAQTLEVGTPVLEEVRRTNQLRGIKSSEISFTIRPINNLNGNDSLKSIIDSSILSTSTFVLFTKKATFKLLPVSVNQQYNTHHPFGWNDGAMIQAKGYQTKISAGFFSKFGHFSIQVKPEFVYAQNKEFSTFPKQHNDTAWKSYYSVLNSIDNPEKFGSGWYVKLFPGQSSARLTFGKLSFGLSTENIWWGPGIRNSIIMSNNAPGFPHATFNSATPVATPVGFFEWQIIAGKLYNSNIIPSDTNRTFNNQKLFNSKDKSSRYLNGMVVTWQPKWTPGFYVGFTRMFHRYQTDLKKISDYLPIMESFFKYNTPDEEDELRKDQMLSLFFRWILKKEQAEIYAEFGRNDHAQNVNDFLLEPEHSRAYLIGMKKIFETFKRKHLELSFEITQLQLPQTKIVRAQNSWYSHHQILQGYTNFGQVLGAGIGPGGNSQTLGLRWLKGIESFGLSFDRVVHNNDFYFDAFGARSDFGSHWIDLALTANKNWVRKPFVYQANLSLVRSLNYQWRTEELNMKRNAMNVHAALSILYFL
jgi:hypothetical protein